MKLIQLLGLFLITLGFSQCKTMKFDKTPPFKITEATYTHWVGGQPGVSGTRIEIRFETNPESAFDSIFFQNKSTKLQRREFKEKVFLTANFNTSKVNSKADLILHSDAKEEVGNKLPEMKKTPFELKENEAVISYIENGKTKYYKILELKKGKANYYP
jgi:hypothetical protein